MTLKLISAPANEPVSLADAKLHLRVTDTAEDSLVTGLIVAARRAAEHELQRALITQTWELALDEFPVAEIELPMPTVQSIVSVEYVDSAGAEQTLDPAAYVLEPLSLPGWLFPVTGTTWPAAFAGSTNTVRVRFVAGYGDLAADVPANVVAWIKLAVGALYLNRESGLPPGCFAPSLLDPERTYL